VAVFVTDTDSGQSGASGSPGRSHERLVPADKGLTKEQLASLAKRGSPEVFGREDLHYIGMPVGGICAGQVYLTGDGRLAYWDIFKSIGGKPEIGDPRGLNYAAPFVPQQSFAQGFALSVDGGPPRRLDDTGFAQVRFEGTYPMARVLYLDDASPVVAELEAYSPFIPLEPEDSALPVTIMSYSLINRSERRVSVDIAGWLENAACPFEPPAEAGQRFNVARDARSGVILDCGVDIEAQYSKLEGIGSMSMALVGASNTDRLALALPCGPDIFARVFSGTEGSQSGEARFGMRDRRAVSASRRVVLEPGQTTEVTFLVAWHFPRYSKGKMFFSTMDDIEGLEQLRRNYAKRFASSGEVAQYVLDQFARLRDLTRRWVRTWNDSTLPHWFLNRTFANTSTLATQTCHWFDNDRFYGWEGVYSCPGTCQHVWHYAQAVSRLFPSLERGLREHIDYGIAFGNDGSLAYRAEASAHGDMYCKVPAEKFFAADGQLGTILRVYREHRMTADDGFLRRLWPRVRQSMRFMMDRDADGDGLLDGPQYNTLDTNWYGSIPSISSLFLAALAAAREMALEMGDPSFAAECDARLQCGSQSFDSLYNGEYYVHHADPTHPEALDLGEGCFIDQVIGQSFAFQAGAGRILPADRTQSALRALFTYNFSPDVGVYRHRFTRLKGGRWYAMPGEAGLIMCTWPRDDLDQRGKRSEALGFGVTSEAYLNECMTGFEYQVASHMVAEGLIDEGLTIVRAIHERYHPSKRNPYNEIECGDHYARAMASYGVFISACGFEYHGPRGYLSFDPKISPDRFKAAFTAAEGWGSIEQIVDIGVQRASITVAHGQLQLSRMELRCPADVTEKSLFSAVTFDGSPVTASVRVAGGRVCVEFNERLVVREGGKLTVHVSSRAFT
jgi:non-lysosomal glucosylceramidase